MQKGFKGIIIVPFFILFITQLNAQISSVSPYSKIGVGDLYSNAYSAAQGYAGANLGIFDNTNVNFLNPASYTALDLTAFEIGFQGSSIQQRQSNPDIFEKNGSAGLRYFAFGVPLKDWWGAAIGLQPYSLKGYSISSSTQVVDQTVSRQTDGNGGLNQLFIGNSFEVANGLSLGVNSSFIFGKVEESRYILWDNSKFYNTKVQEVANIRGAYFSFGAQYQHNLKDDRELGIGATFSNSMNLNTTVGNYSYTFIGQPGLESPIDSTALSSSIDSKIKLPSEFGFGISYGKKKKSLYNGNHAWAINADFHLYNGSEFKNFDGGNTNMVDGYKAELGGFFIPIETFSRLQKSRSYTSIIQYRFGGFYEKTAFNVNGTDIYNYGMTFGMGIPLRRSNIPGVVRVNTINTGIVVGRRGTTNNGLIQETYVNFYLGLTLNDKWFIKYKYR
mgnify:CR=1 FL=1|tara:strand:- start:16936 stop:18270 length:1335 start_codon:yes stop_codon:yes gene_type:complete